MSRVAAMAKTPSLNASSLEVDTARRRPQGAGVEAEAAMNTTLRPGRGQIVDRWAALRARPRPPGGAPPAPQKMHAGAGRTAGRVLRRAGYLSLLSPGSSSPEVGCRLRDGR